MPVPWYRALRPPPKRRCPHRGRARAGPIAACDRAAKQAAKRNLPAGTWRVVRISVTPGSVVCVRVAFAGLRCAALPRDRYQRRRLPPHRRLAGCRLRLTTRALPGVSERTCVARRSFTVTATGGLRTSGVSPRTTRYRVLRDGETPKR